MQSFFTKNSDFDIKLKPKLESILGPDYQMKGSGFNTEEFEHRSIGIQCSLPIDKSLILIAPRSVSE